MWAQVQKQSLRNLLLRRYSNRGLKRWAGCLEECRIAQEPMRVNRIRYAGLSEAQQLWFDRRR